MCSSDLKRRERAADATAVRGALARNAQAIRTVIASSVRSTADARRVRPRTTIARPGPEKRIGNRTYPSSAMTDSGMSKFA